MAGLNWTSEVVFNLVAMGIIFAALVWFLLAIYRGNRYRYFTYLVLIEALYLVRFAFIHVPWDFIQGNLDG